MCHESHLFEVVLWPEQKAMRLVRSRLVRVDSFDVLGCLVNERLSEGCVAVGEPK